MRASNLIVPFLVAWLGLCILGAGACGPQISDAGIDPTTDAGAAAVPDGGMLGGTDAGPEVDLPSGLNIRTFLDNNSAPAGEVVGVSCVAVDNTGAVYTVPTVVTAPGLTVAGNAVLGEAPGVFTVTCEPTIDLDDETLTSAELTVSAGTPTRLEVTWSPAKVAYALLDEVDLEISVADGFCTLTSVTNAATVTVSPAGATQLVAGQRYRILEAGLVTFDISWTDGANSLHTTSFLVGDATPPNVTVTAPSPQAAYVVGNAAVNVTGTATDLAGILSLTVGGQPVVHRRKRRDDCWAAGQVCDDSADAVCIDVP